MDMNEIIRPSFIVIAMFLNILGVILKYRTPIFNKLLPAILFSVGFSICAVWGWFTSVYLDGARVMDALLICGLVHGFIVTSIAVMGWDTIYGFYKNGLNKKRRASK